MIINQKIETNVIMKKSLSTIDLLPYSTLSIKAHLKIQLAYYKIHFDLHDNTCYLFPQHTMSMANFTMPLVRVCKVGDKALGF